jgi:hypothetical protein
VKKPSLSDAPAQKQSSVPAAVGEPPPPVAEAPRVAKIKDGRTTTTLRIDPEQLEALKIIAAKKRVKVNDLLLQGAAHILALHGYEP